MYLFLWISRAGSQYKIRTYTESLLRRLPLPLGYLAILWAGCCMVGVSRYIPHCFAQPWVSDPQLLLAFNFPQLWKTPTIK